MTCVRKQQRLKQLSLALVHGVPALSAQAPASLSLSLIHDKLASTARVNSCELVSNAYDACIEEEGSSISELVVPVDEVLALNQEGVKHQ